MYFTSKLMAYLKYNHRRRWEELTTVMGFSGGSNPFASIPYFFDNRDVEDPIISKCKKNIRIGLVVAGAFLVLILIGVTVLFVFFRN